MGDVLKEYTERIGAIPGIWLDRTRLTWVFDSTLDTDPKRAIMQIRVMQKQLRAIRTEVCAATKQAAAHSRAMAAIADSTFRPGMLGIVLGSKYRTLSRSLRAGQKDVARADRQKELAPYEQVKALIDRIDNDLYLRKARLQLE